ncbi:MAG: secretin N-terminal domain-containing protein [Kiritimatiellia bacterium]
MKHVILSIATLFLSTGLIAQVVRRPPSITTNRNTPANPASNSSSTEVAQQLAKAEKGKSGRPKLKFDNAPVELFLQIYAQVTKRTLLSSPDVPKVTMSLRSNDEENWSDAEYLQAIETQLQLNGIGLIPVGERFVLVVPFKTIGQQGIETYLELPVAGRHPEEGKIIRQILTPKNISAEEAQKAIESFKRSDGQIQYLERTNSLLITDTQENVNRMIEIINFIDKPLPVMEEVQVRAIKHARAEDIKKALEEFVEASQKQDDTSKKSTAAPRTGNSISGGMQQGFSKFRVLPGAVIRAGNNQQELSNNAPSIADALVSDADRGMIRGKVQIMSDTRSNQLIIVTRPANMLFFDRIISVLDIETAPEIAVEIIRLRYASADTKDSEKGVAELLNELIDSAGSSSKNKDSEVNGVSAGTDGNLTNNNFVPSPAVQAIKSSLSPSIKSKLGELRKENIKILSDKRINAVMIMASPGDLAALKEIIASMDIQVAQVMIETVVLNVSLGSDFSTGIEWVKRATANSRYRDAIGGGGMPTAGGNPLNLSLDTVLGNIATNAVNMVGMSGGAQYFGTINKLNLDFLIKATESDSRTKVLTSPVLMTQDNKEATLEATELAYLYAGMKYMGSSYSGSDYQPDIKQEEVGLTIKVTPRINPDGTVVLTIAETFQDNTKTQNVPGSGANGASADWPVITTRKLTADVSVTNGQTVILGGLVKQGKIDKEGGIPFLKDIPYFGRYLFGYTEQSDVRDELLVFLTPYVFTSPEKAQEEAKRRKDYLNAAGVWNQGWSKSALADPLNEEDKLSRDRDKRIYSEKQYKAHQKRIEADLDHDKKIAERLEKSIERKKEALKVERTALTEEQVKAREADIQKEDDVHAALLLEIMKDSTEE